MQKEHEKSLIDIYCQEIGRMPLLTHKQVVRLAERIKRGSVRAWQRLIESNLLLVVSIAKHYARKIPNSSLLDLIQEGNLGLFKAVSKFDGKRKIRFSTYASYWIKRAVKDAAGNHSRVVMVPLYMVASIAKYREAERRLFNIFDRPASTEEIAQEMGVKVKKVLRIERVIASTSTCSLKAATSENVVRSLRDFKGEEQNPVSSGITENGNSIEEIVKTALDKLPPREREVLLMRFGFRNNRAYTLREVSEVLGLTKERVRQIQVVALNRLRRHTAISGLG